MTTYPTNSIGKEDYCLNLAEVCAMLDCYEQQVPLSVLYELAAALHDSLAIVERYSKFNDNFYSRCLVHEGPAYQVLVLSWRSGQVSPIHNHKNSHCVVRVLMGTASEIEFQCSGCDLLYPKSCRRLNTDAITASSDLDIHQMGNLEAPGHGLVTLHFYSPALTKMETFSLNNSIFGDYQTLLTRSKAFPAYRP